MGDKIDQVAHAICPLLKPWMDAVHGRRHSCLGCTDSATEHGTTTPLCLRVARDIARVARAALETSTPAVAPLPERPIETATLSDLEAGRLKLGKTTIRTKDIADVFGQKDKP